LVYLSALVGGAVYLAGAAQAQTPGAGAPPVANPAPRGGGKVAVFNVAKVMKDYQRWQYYASLMNQKRTAAAGDLGKLRSQIADLQDKIQKEPIKQKQEEMAKQLVDLQRTFEDKERTVRKQLDDESAGYLKNLFTEIQQAVKAIADTNGFDIVLAYPDAISAEEMNSPVYYDLKMRPPAAMPFYVAASADTTDVLVLTLNKNFPPPSPIPGGAVQPTGGAQPPPAHGAPPPGTPGTPGSPPPGRPGG
jgi:Skp family chaperone for outer membrane proteins